MYVLAGPDGMAVKGWLTCATIGLCHSFSITLNFKNIVIECVLVVVFAVGVGLPGANSGTCDSPPTYQREEMHCRDHNSASLRRRLMGNLFLLDNYCRAYHSFRLKTDVIGTI